MEGYKTWNLKPETSPDTTVSSADYNLHHLYWRIPQVLDTRDKNWGQNYSFQEPWVANSCNVTCPQVLVLFGGQPTKICNHTKICFWNAQPIHIKSNSKSHLVPLFWACNVLASIVLIMTLLRWFFNIFSIEIQAENDHQYIQIIHQIEIKTYLLFVSRVEVQFLCHDSLWTDKHLKVVRFGCLRTQFQITCFVMIPHGMSHQTSHVV